MGKLDDKVAIITGSSGSIGKETALEFAREGADVVVHYRSDKKEALNVVDEIQKLGRNAFATKIDFSDENGVEKKIRNMVGETVKKFKKIDILVNLAGYYAEGVWNKHCLDYDSKGLYDILKVDTVGTFLMVKHVAPRMLKQKRGVIINTSSTPAIAGHDKGFGFTVAKAANPGMTKGLALELGPHIRVNAIAPGDIDTRWIKELSKEDYEKAKNEAALRRLGKPSDVAKVLAFLASDESSFINGQTIVIDGGTVLY